MSFRIVLFRVLGHQMIVEGFIAAVISLFFSFYCTPVISQTAKRTSPAISTLEVGSQVKHEELTGTYHPSLP